MGDSRTNQQHVPFKKMFLMKKKTNMELTENELVQIIKLFNCIQLILVFTSLLRFLKRVKRLNKSNECFYWSERRILKTPSERSLHYKYVPNALQVHLRALVRTSLVKELSLVFVSYFAEENTEINFSYSRHGHVIRDLVWRNT